MANKVHALKREDRGQEYSRNNMEMQLETSQIHYLNGELPYSCQVEDDWSKINSYLASVKKLNNEKLSKKPGTRNNASNLVARLMGIDMMPPDTKSVVPSHESMEFGPFYQDIEDDGWEQNYGKPRPREHHQVEELQKFKKEFEAYQAEKSMECLKDSETGSVSGQMLAQENLNKKKQSFPSRDSIHSRDFEESLIMNARSSLDLCSSPSQIVILKASPDRVCDCYHEENRISSSGPLQGRYSIEEFLEEVGERLKYEMQGKAVKKGSIGRGSGIETPYYEKLSDPKEIAHYTAKEVSESVTRDNEMTLIRSKSTQKPFSTRWSRIPEFFNRDTRNFFSRTLRNVVKSEAHFDIPEMTCGNSSSYTLDNHLDILKKRKEIQTESFRHETDDNLLLHKEFSPQKLVRSLSAPIVLLSRTPFEKLEAVESIPDNIRKQKKDRFKFKEKVSSFKHAFDLRRKLFGKRVHSMVESHCNEHDPSVRDIRSGPTVLMKFGERHENSTEVPPSPASVWSFAQEELWTHTEYLSPVSTPVVSSIDDIAMPKDFRDIISGLKDLRRQLSKLESDSPDDLTMKQEPLESELVQLEDPAESYVRDLLVASGLYFGLHGKSLSKGDTIFAKQIGNSDFEEVEESHKKLIKENEKRSMKDHNHDIKLEHMVLLDLLNEALSIVLGPPLSKMPSFRRKLSNSWTRSPPCGKELLKLVWDIIRVSLYPSSSASLYSQDLRSIFWSELINEQINVLEREIAWLIVDDLVEEFTNNMLLGIM